MKRMLVLAAALVVAVPALAQYPNRPIRIVVPFGAGSATDLISRVLGNSVSAAIGQPVVVDNKAGADGAIAASEVAKAAPDGYTLLMATNSPLSVVPAMKKVPPYDPVADFTPITDIGRYTFFVVSYPGLPVKTLPELIALARAQPGQITLASAGTGTSTHLAIELLKTMAKIDVVHVPFKGGGGGIVGVMGGQLSGVMTVLTLVQSHHITGKVRIVAVTTLKRSPLANDIPTFAEAGLPGYEAAAWVGLFAPRATPQPIIQKWNAEINRVIRDAELKERFKAAGLTAPGGSEREFNAYFVKETERWAALIKAANISIAP